MSCNWISTGVSDNTKPVKPPRVNRNKKPRQNNIGVSSVMEPRHIVANQLKILAAVGTAISIVANMKYNCPAIGKPVVYMWCAQTMNERIAMEAVA